MPGPSPAKPTHLRCEYLQNPRGLDVPRPRLSWRMEDPRRGARQTAYRVLVASSPERLARDEGDLWDSGTVASERTLHVAYAGRALASHARCFWKVRLWDAEGAESPWSDPASFTLGLLDAGEWKARWIRVPASARPPVAWRPERNRYLKKTELRPSPLLRRAFVLERPVREATVYASALGLYALSLNGQPVGDQHLAPEWTSYQRRVLYQAHDVAHLLRPGENVLGAVLADGWYSGFVGPLFKLRKMYGEERALLLQLRIVLDDGSVYEVASDGTWRCHPDGPTRRADLFLGEIHDARREVPGWDAPGFHDGGWVPVAVDDSVQVERVAQRHEPIREVETLRPVSVREVAPGTFIADLGQNIAGVCSLRLSGELAEPGTEVRLRHAEMLDAQGRLYTENLKYALATDVFIPADAAERTFRPRFTYHGFQYVEVSGLRPGASLTPERLTAHVLSSDCARAGDFESSDATLNRLWHNIFWTQRDNLHGVPTDCPQRSERVGWTGDVQVFAQTSLFNMDLAAFYAKWLRDVRDEQFPDGLFPIFAPNPLRRGWTRLLPQWAPGWSDAGVTVAWDHYLHYGDEGLLREHYPAARGFVDAVHRYNPGLVWKKRTGFHFADWLNGDTLKAEGYPRKGAAMPKDVFATAFFAHSTRLLARMARVLGEAEDARRYEALADRIRDAFNAAFVSSDGRLKGDTQGGYALALHFDLLPEALRPRAAAHLVEALERYDGRLSTGFHTTLRMMSVLTRFGHADVAYRLLFSRRFPSWFYMIEQGATTMWERWDGYVKGRGFQSPSMNSFNHYSIGAVGEWMYRVLLGIDWDEARPAWKHVVLRPEPGGPLEWARGGHTCVHGPIRVEWRREDDTLWLEVTVPPNTTATLFLPTDDATAIHEGDRPLGADSQARLVGVHAGKAELALTSGTWRFRAPLRAHAPSRAA